MQLAASTKQSYQFFERTLPEQLFESKNEETIKKYENLRDIYKLGPIHQNYAWPDPISWDNSINCGINYTFKLFI